MKKKQKLLRLEDALKQKTPVDRSLNKYTGRVLFPEQLERINQLLRIPGFAAGLKKAMGCK